MKKLILLLFIFVITSCTDQVVMPLIVDTVSNCNDVNSSNFKYVVRFEGNSHIDFYTNTKYSIGDTLK